MLLSRNKGIGNWELGIGNWELGTMSFSGAFHFCTYSAVQTSSLLI
ncbi:MAG: hypothetical protein F6K47_39270 [Symploca sp. SIO2E6]|nr:hypothetical protein [Symploca sp. SIO2E6]